MSNSRSDLIELLAAEDPARNLQPRTELRSEAWKVVRASINERTAGTGGDMGRRGLVRPLRAIAIGICIALASVGVALASGVLKVGAPAKLAEEFQIPTSGLGGVAAGSPKLLAISTPDPWGGAPWGLRTFTTTRGAGCVQIGRVVDGRIGVLGIDGAFSNDERLHPIPVASASELVCSALDANGRIFANVSKNNQLSNGLDGPEEAPSAAHPSQRDVCAAAAATPAEKSSAMGRICPASEERAVYYGLLGPDATAITYVDEGKSVTTPTSGPEGAYLIVTPAAPGWHPNEPYGPGATGLLPLEGPIVEIHYRNGSACRLTPTPDPSCTPGGAPVGYEPAEPVPTSAQAAAPVSAQLVPAAGGQHEAIVSFAAPLPATSVRDGYVIRWTHAGATPEQNSVQVSEADVQAGDTVRARSGPLPRGTTTLQVVLQHATGPALFEGAGTVSVPVGAATVNVP